MKKKQEATSYPPLTVHGIGLHITHEPGQEINRPQGYGDWLLLCFLDEAEVWLSHDWQTAPASSCLIYSPRQHERFRATEKSFRHHFMHFAGSDIHPFMQQIACPVLTVLPIWDASIVENGLKKIHGEALHARLYWNEIALSIFQSMIREIVRMSYEEARHSSHSSRQINALREVRSLLYTSPEEPWQVGDLAAEAHLSDSRFAHLYKECFGISPIEDLTQARLRKACELLKRTNMTNEAIAGACGFGSPEHFSRTFRRHIGSTPRAYAHSAENPSSDA